MGERLDRALVLAERLVAAVERGADALERIATFPSGKLPPRAGKQRRQHPPRPPAEPVDELVAARARRALERAGVR